MDTGKIKNILIIILVILDVFLLSAVVSDRVQSRRAERQALEDAFAAIENTGISVSESFSMPGETPKAYSVKRDMDDEKDKIKKLLGGVTASDMGGNIWFYSSAKGQASLRGTGEMDILVSSGTYSGGASAEKTAEKIMNKLGLEAGTVRSDVLDDGGARVLELGCMWNGGEVYNASIKFTFSSDELVMISGTRVFDAVSETNGTEVMNALTAMMRFVEVIRQEGLVCSELLSADVGYIMSVPLSGEGTMTPVWHFTTDAGDVYINGLTGKMETVG